jgi:hypothetical protein
VVGEGATGDANGGSNGSGSGSGSGSGDGGMMLPVDATVVGGTGGETCATPQMLQLGVTYSAQTLAGATNDIMFPSCQDGVEVVYGLMTTGGNFRVSITADFGGIMAFADACPPVLQSTCSPFSANLPKSPTISLASGMTWIAIEKTGAGGTTFTLSAQ